MKKMHLILLAVLLCLWNGTAAQIAEQDNGQNMIFIVGMNNFGVMDVGTGQLIVDSVYQSVEIYDGPVIYCASDSFRVNGVLYRLPAKVVDIYRADGCLVAHDYEALLSADKLPYTATIDFAKAKGYKDLESYAKFLIGVDYEKQGMRREAYQNYIRACRLNPKFTIAKTYADNVVAEMKEEQRAESERIRREDIQAEIAAAEFQARCNAIAAGLSVMGESLAQVASQSAALRQNADTPQQNAVTPRQSASTSKASESKNAKQKENCVGTVSVYGVGEAFGKEIDYSQNLKLYQDSRGYYIKDFSFLGAKLYLHSNKSNEDSGYSVGMYNYTTLTSNGTRWYFKL